MHDTSPTPRQHDILILLYRFRFLNRVQIQRLLNHHYHSRTIIWLNELLTHEYVRSYPDARFAPTATVYSLSTVGRKYLKEHVMEKTINLNALRQVWRESHYSEAFRNRCLFLADAYLSLWERTEREGTPLRFYTKAELQGTEHFIAPLPDAYFVIEAPGEEDRRCFLEILEDIPSSALRRRVGQYFDYFKGDEWQAATGKEFPEILLVCPNTRIKSHLFFYVRKRLQEEPDVAFLLATRDSVRERGLDREVMQQVVPED